MKINKYFLFLAIAVIVTFFVRPMFSWAEDRYSDLQNFSKILNLVQQYYVEPVDTKKLPARASVCKSANHESPHQIEGKLYAVDPL